jgi:hypothetical protein
MPPGLGKPPVTIPLSVPHSLLTTRSTYHRPEVSHIISLSRMSPRESLSVPSSFFRSRSGCFKQSGTPGRARLSTESVLLRDPKIAVLLGQGSREAQRQGRPFAPQRGLLGPCELLDRGLASVEGTARCHSNPCLRALSGNVVATESQERPEVVSGCVRPHAKRLRRGVPRASCTRAFVPARRPAPPAPRHTGFGTRKMHGGRHACQVGRPCASYRRGSLDVVQGWRRAPSRPRTGIQIQSGPCTPVCSRRPATAHCRSVGVNAPIGLGDERLALRPAQRDTEPPARRECLGPVPQEPVRARALPQAPSGPRSGGP